MNFSMSIYHWILLFGFGISSFACAFQLFKILFSGTPKDYSFPLGKVGPAIKYSFTGAMSPLKKETAYLHLPTYSAGIFFHLGTFLSLILLVLNFFSIIISNWLVITAIILLSISSLSGLSILIKRVSASKMRSISNPDDYVSNLLVTGFQVLSLLSLVWSASLPYLFIYATILFLYVPLGKLRHTVYFFSARIHLALFYGKRGVWPMKGNNS
jgi:hypothetical protein